MKEKLIVFFSIVMICLLFVSCGNNNGTGPNDESEFILTLTVGNEWQYVDSESDSVNMIMQIIDSQNVNYNNENITVFSLNMIEEDNNDTLFVYNKSDGLYLLSPNFDNEWLFLKYPVNGDDTWYNPFEGGIIKCLSTNHSIVTPAGNFDCFVYGLTEYNNGSPYTEIYCHPNIGFVAFHYDINGEEDKWFLLNTYTIN